jgi:hypothetical protein
VGSRPFVTVQPVRLAAFGRGRRGLCRSDVKLRQEVPVRLLHLPVDGDHGACPWPARDNPGEPVVHLGQRFQPAAALQQRESITMLGSLRPSRTSSEALHHVLRAGQQDHLDELDPDIVAELLQREHEVQPAEELRPCIARTTSMSKASVSGWSSTYRLASVDLPLLGAPLISTRRGMLQHPDPMSRLWQARAGTIDSRANRSA